ncbi:hypothetical protein [Cytobacillus gottheilii]|uniref:hypothetical protein n=1 Tax=Cytobacillus gottheilii TaxID=859144 RepID=UPI002494EC1D|nr:hypothetical protein [Cytobacillus gottheilii]
MLIQLDKSIEQDLFRNLHNLNENSLEVRAINNLAIAYRNGWHIIIGPLRILKLIKNLEHIDKSTKLVFDELINDYTFQKSYKDLVEEFILVKGLDGEPKRIENENETSYYYEAPLNYFNIVTRCFRSTLLCEDESDYDFYNKLVKKYIKENKEISGVDICFSSSNGGGVNAYKALERGINESRNPILAIADSDMKYPNSSEGQTLKKLKQKENQYMSTNIIEVYPLQVRAKENLIPPSLYLLGTGNSYKNHLKKLELIEKLNSEQLLYFNIKDGYKVKHFKDLRFMEYYKNIFLEVDDLISCSIEEIDKKTDDDEIVVNGAKGIVEKFTYYFLENGIEQELQSKKRLSNPSPQLLSVISEMEAILEKKENLFNNLPEYILEVILDLCKKIISWGCSKGNTYGTLGA